MNFYEKLYFQQQKSAEKYYNTLSKEHVIHNPSNFVGNFFKKTLSANRVIRLESWPIINQQPCVRHFCSVCGDVLCQPLANSNFVMEMQFFNQLRVPYFCCPHCRTVMFVMDDIMELVVPTYMYNNFMDYYQLRTPTY